MGHQKFEESFVEEKGEKEEEEEEETHDVSSEK